MNNAEQVIYRKKRKTNTEKEKSTEVGKKHK